MSRGKKGWTTGTGRIWGSKEVLPSHLHHKKKMISKLVAYISHIIFYYDMFILAASWTRLENHNQITAIKNDSILCYSSYGD